MTRIVVGNRDGALALSQARSVVAELTDEWPDINFVQRTVPAGADGDTAALLTALERNQLSIAMVSMERLPLMLPEEVTLVSVSRRFEAKSTLLGKSRLRLADLKEGDRIGVPGPRDALFLTAVAPGIEAVVLQEQSLDNHLRLIAEDELHGLLLPASVLHELDRRNLIGELLEMELFPPACGQGSVGLLVREDDDAASELAYTLQHRPSFDRVTAEMSFRNTLSAADGKLLEQNGVPAIGALATVTSDGELTLFGAAISASGNLIQATSSGEAAEAADLGRELATDFLNQLN